MDVNGSSRNPQIREDYEGLAQSSVGLFVERYLVHNHPSGDATPSKADIEMTREVQEAATRLGISVHDHIVISKSGHNSFKSLGLL